MDISKSFSNFKLDTETTTPLYVQIGEYMIRLIEENYLRPHSKLPPERELAFLLGVSRTTAINAYRYLEKKGVAQTKIGSGTYTCKQNPGSELAKMPWGQLCIPFPQTSQTGILKELVSTPYSDDLISLGAGMPDPEFYPLTVMQELLNKLSNVSRRDFGHIATEGYQPLKEAIADFLAQKSIKTKLDEVMVVSGSQQGLYLLSKIFIQPGDYVMIESPTYIGAIQTFQMAGARLLAIPSSERLDFAMIEDFLIRYRPKLFYMMPTYQNPTGRVVSLEERKQLIQLAARHRLPIIEDDAYGDLYYEQKPPVSLKALDTYGGVIYLGTFSKILFPGLRTGWVAAAGEVIRRLSYEKQYADLHSNNLTQWLLGQYVSQGFLQGHLDTVREQYKLRRDAAMQAVRRYGGMDFEFEVPEGGFYLWCTLHSVCSPAALLYESARKGVSFVPGDVFYADEQNKHQVRLCFTTHSPEKITEGIKRLSLAVKEAAKGNMKSKRFPGQNIPII